MIVALPLNYANDYVLMNSKNIILRKQDGVMIGFYKDFTRMCGENKYRD